MAFWSKKKVELTPESVPEPPSEPKHEKKGGKGYFISRWLPILVPVLLGIFLADIATDVTTYLVHELPKSVRIPRRTRLEGTVESQLKRSVLSDLVARNLFDHTNFVPGRQKPTRRDDKLDPANATPSSLPYTVIGTLVFTDAFKSICVLAKGRDLKQYFKDDPLESGYKIWGIERRKVYIHNLRRGALEYLALKDKLPDTRVKGAGSIALPTGPAKVDGIKTSGDNKFSVDKGFLKKKLEGQNLLNLLSQARAVPTPDGFKLVAIEPGSLYEAIGLEQGDVISGVNDKQVRTQADALLLYNQFKSGTSPSISLHIKRGGEKTTLQYELGDFK